MIDNSSQTPETPPLEEPTDNSSQTPETPPLEGAAIVGFYDMFLGQGNPTQEAPILAAGFEPVSVFDLSPAELSAIDVLFVQNPDNGSYGLEYLANLGNIENAVEKGLTLIIHDRFVTEAETILPGGEDFDIRRDFADDADIDVRNPSSDLIEGPGGVITDTTLDGGTSSSHGFAVEGTLPEDADLALSRSDPSEIVTFSYEFGAGHAVYSSIPLDFYLEGFGPPDVSENFRDIYAPNVVEYGVELIGFPGELENGSFETGDFRGWRTIGNNSIETADFGSGPTRGTFQALLTNAASRSDSPVVDSELEEFLDLAPGVLDGLGNGDVTEGSAIKQTFTAEAGDILRFDWDFLTNETTPEDTFNDFAFFSLTPLTLELADTGESFVSSLTPFSQETGFQTESIAISEAGTYSLGFGVVDVEDDIIDSGLLIDNVRIGEDDGGVFYSTDRATDQVFQIDPQTGEATLVGNVGFDTSFSGLSIDDDGPLFASDLFDPSTFEWSLATLDLDTGAADIIGPQFDTDIHAIAHQDGTLYGFSIFQGLGTLDPATGEFTASFDSFTLPVEMRGADLDESTNTLYALGADNVLYTIDVDTGSASFVGSTGVDFNFRMGLAFNPLDNQLYALGDDSNSGDNLYRIDKDTGAATLIGNTGLVEADSLEFVGISPPLPDLEYDIDVVFIDDSLTPSQQAVFEDAAERWEEIITDDVPDVVVPGFGFVDDVAMDASAPFIDGPGGILGQAGPTVFREGSFLPARGIMQFDSADLQFLEDSGLLEDVILHEMAHVIGFGTIWQDLDLLTGAGGADPRFVGAEATDEYNDIFGVSESGVPVEADFGPGTALSHWDEDLFGNELMTGFIGIGDNPLSRITAASMGDLGYEVNVDAADVYAPPFIGDPSLEPVGRIVTMEDLERTFVKPGVVGHDSALDFERTFV